MGLMKAVKKQAPGKGVAVTVSDVPETGPNDVLIKVRMAGICGTDLHIYQWDEWAKNRIKPPVIIGHEFVGEVYRLGSNVDHLRTGQRVSAEGHITCGHCRLCKNGHGHVCPDFEIIGVDRDGCFAEYISVPATNVWPVPDAIPDRHAALFDPIGNAMHTVMAQPISMRTVLITGAGSIGLFVIPIAKANGAARVIVMEPNSMKRQIALQVGADMVIDPVNEDVKKKVMEFTGNEGVDVLLEMSGNESALHTGLELLSNGGDASLLGIPSRQVPIDLAREIIFKGITIRGITGRRMYETWYQCESFLLKNGNSIEPIITHTLCMEDIEEGFKLMEANEAVKVLVRVS